MVAYEVDNESLLTPVAAHPQDPGSAPPAAPHHAPPRPHARAISPEVTGTRVLVPPAFL